MVLEFSHSSKDGGGYGRRYYKCRCDCGSEVVTTTSSLTSGNSSSCGCARREQCAARLTKHGLGSVPEYEIWCSMKKRCQNKNCKAYKNYGARGIKVCERWNNSFEAFLEDMGSRPSPLHSLDRIDNNRGYEPANCRWATDKEQGRNKRDTTMITIRGERRPLIEWCEVLGTNYRTAKNRLRKGWSEEAALMTEPLRCRRYPKVPSSR